MAISHVCMSCGLDLARVRARVEPRYALPIVVCPDCGWAAVRRKYRRTRAVLRLQVSLVTLVIQLGLFAAALLGVTGMSMDLGKSLDRGAYSLSSGEFRLWLAASIGFAVALGAWLTAAFGHCRQFRTWLVFTGSAAVLLTLAPLFDAQPQWLPERYAVLALLMVVATAGVPVGMLARHAGRVIERAMWRSRRQRLRARSVGR